MPIREVPLPHVHEEELPAFFKHVCPPTFGHGRPLDPVTPTRTIECKLLVNIGVDFRDHGSIEMWTIEDPTDPEGGRVWPAKTIRTVEGDIIHARVEASTNTHTIHWHGIEPTTMNDGVGKHSYEISGKVVYQFATNTAGTFFYHCHKNTVLHFERGLYGLFIVDPKRPDVPEAAGVPEPPYRDGGPGFVTGLNPPTNLIKYDVEALWAFDEIDTRWIGLNHNAFMQFCDPADPIKGSEFSQNGFLNDFRPDVFTISGALRRQNDSEPFEEVAVNAEVGQTVLLRILNSGYTIQDYRIGLPAVTIGMDGHALGADPYTPYSRPISLAAGQPFTLTTAMRHNLIVKPTEKGQFPVECRMRHWVTGKEFFIARTFINVS